MDKKYNLAEQEQILIRQLKTKEPGAFKDLVELYQHRVINTCYRFVFNNEDAEDIAQETFIEVHRSITAFKEQSKLSTWIYRIAVTKSIDFLRKSKRKKRLAPLKNLLGTEDDIKNIPAPLDSDPAKNLEQQERMRILQEAIDSLPENQRIAFTLSKCKGFGNKEITEIMDTTLSSVESLMHRAKNNLKKKLYRHFEKELQKKGTTFTILFFALFFLFPINDWQKSGKNEKYPQVFSCFYVSNNENCFVVRNFWFIINNRFRGHHGYG